VIFIVLCGYVLVFSKCYIMNFFAVLGFEQNYFCNQKEIFFFLAVQQIKLSASGTLGKRSNT
jgi:hypothetical protein